MSYSAIVSSIFCCRWFNCVPACTSLKHCVNAVTVIVRKAAFRQCFFVDVHLQVFIQTAIWISAYGGLADNRIKFPSQVKINLLPAVYATNANLRTAEYSFSLYLRGDRPSHTVSFFSKQRLQTSIPPPATTSVAADWTANLTRNLLGDFSGFVSR